MVRITATPAAQLTGIPAERGSVRTDAPALLQLAAGDDGAYRQSVGERLGYAHHVGDDAGVFEGPHATGSGDSGLDLVADEQDAVPVAQGPQFAQERGGSRVEAALALDRLDDDGRD